MGIYKRTIKNNLTATTDPSVSDDNTKGYSVGSRWINTVADRAFACMDNATDAAVWEKVTDSDGGTF